MQLSVILAHPSEDSFNHAIAVTTVDALHANGHKVFFHDLYKEKFDPILPFEEISREALLPPDIQKHCTEIKESDGIIIVHPNWWGQPPAILTGWIDRVIRPDVAYEFLEGDNGDGVPKGLLHAKSAIVFNTSNTETAREQTVFGDPLESIWKSCIFDLCGVDDFYRKMFNTIIVSSVEQREKWLSDVEATINKYYPQKNITNQCT